ncbi:MAG: hypothetical protein P4M05_08340 [Bradyrhizobium sp.]|nr:hypothetical protein [Bradyrhizobium sp.]
MNTHEMQLTLVMGFAKGSTHRWDYADGPARSTQFTERNQADLPRPVPFAKIFSFPSDPNQLHVSRRLVPMEGRLAIVTDAGRDAVDAGGASDEGADFADGEVVWS